MPPLRIDHFALPVFDVEASERFYSEVLELPLVQALSGDDWGGKPWLMMMFSLGDGKQLALCALRGVERPDESALPRELRHFAFAVDSERELGAWKQRLESRQVAFWEEDHGAQRSVYFEDPNGIVLEVTTPPTPSMQEENAKAAEIVRRFVAETAVSRGLKKAYDGS